MRSPGRPMVPKLPNIQASLGIGELEMELGAGG